MATEIAVALNPRVKHVLLLLSKSKHLLPLGHIALPDVLYQRLVLHEPFLWGLQADQGPQPHIAGGDDVVQRVDILCDGGGLWNCTRELQLRD